MRWVVPSLGTLLGVAALLNGLFARGRVLFSADGDVGRHVHMGRTILDTGMIPRVDLFSHTRAGVPFVPYEWLSETITALVEGWAGLPGVAVMSVLLYTIAVVCVYRTSVLLGAPQWLAIVGGVLALFLLSFRLLPRPHMFTMALAGVFMLVLTRFAVSGRAWSLAPLPILMLFWVNAHGGFLIGFILIGAFLLGALLGSDEFDAPRPAVRPLLVVVMVCLGASLVNPAGLSLWGHVTGYLGIDFLVGITLEYQSVNFHRSLGRVFFICLFAGPALWMTGRVRVSWLAAGLYLFSAAAALHSNRNVTLFAVASLPWLGVWLRDFLATGGHGARARLEQLERLSQVDRQLKPGFGAVALIALVALALGPKADTFRFDDDKFPVVAMDWLERLTPRGPVFNQFRWGGYLLYERPDISVFIDGQTDFYGEELTREYLTALEGRPHWDAVLDKYGVEWTFTHVDSPLNQLLELDEDWRREYRDEVAVIFRRVAPASPDPA